MPKELERKLEAEATQQGITGKRKNAFVYGTMRKTGWKPQRELEPPLSKQRKLKT